MTITSAIHPYFMGKNISHTPSGITKFAGKTFSSDLRKLTAVSKSMSKFKIIYSVIEKLICPSNATHEWRVMSSHYPSEISSCAHLTQICQYIYITELH